MSWGIMNKRKYINMEIGPKETKIPNNWRIEPLNNMFKIIKGHSYKSKFYSKKNDEEAKIFISLKAINKKGGFNKKGVKYYKGEVKPEKKVKPGEIIIANTDLN